MKFWIIASLFVISFPPTSAEEARGSRLSLGAGVGLKRNLRRGNTYKRSNRDFLWTPIPLIQASFGRVSLGPQGLAVRIAGSHFMNVSLFIDRDGDRYDGVGMEARKESFLAGLSAKFQNYGISFSRDIGHRSEGQVGKLSYAKFFSLSESLTLMASAGIEWFDHKFANYYYGVNASEATATRPHYLPGSYWRPKVGAMHIFNLDENVSLLAGANLKYIPKKIRQSPTMNGDAVEIGGLLGGSYKF